MKLNDFFKIFSLFEIGCETNPILLYDFLWKIVDETFDKMNNLIVGDVGDFKGLNIGLSCVLQLHPAEIQLSF